MNTKRIFLVTHGDRHNGPDPVHTEKGLGQIRNLALPTVETIVAGTGGRFQEVYDIVYPKLRNAKGDTPRAFHSPFCGSADGLDKGRVVLTNGRSVRIPEEYSGIVQNPYFDVWGWLRSFEGDTLFCAGGELLTALRLTGAERGMIYEIDLMERSFSKYVGE